MKAKFSLLLLLSLFLPAYACDEIELTKDKSSNPPIQPFFEYVPDFVLINCGDYISFSTTLTEAENCALFIYDSSRLIYYHTCKISQLSDLSIDISTWNDDRYRVIVVVDEKVMYSAYFAIENE